MTHPSRSYRQLPEWQQAMNLAIVVFNESKNLEDDDHVLLEEMQRSCMMIATRIAQGYDEGGSYEFRVYVRRSRSATIRLMTAAELCERLERGGDWNRIIVEAGDMLKALDALIERLKKAE